jgi:hypothetical protein
MALYTYEDFQKALTTSGLSGQFSDADIRLALQNPDAGMGLLNAKISYKNATTDADRQTANTTANSIRSQYGGYTAGGTGLGYTPNVSSGNGYKSPYADEIGKALSDIENYGDFTYDVESDPNYAAYRKQYLREGERAVQDTLGQAAAATGGLPSTYATNSATQAGDYYATKLTDKVPELYQQAYNQWYQTYSMNLDKLSTLQTQDSAEYARYADEQTASTTAQQNALSDAYSAAEIGDYSKLEALGIDTTTYKKNAALKSAYAAADAGDFSQLEALGIDTTNLRAAYQKSLSSGSGSGSSGSGEKFSWNGKTVSYEAYVAFQMLNSGNYTAEDYQTALASGVYSAQQLAQMGIKAAGTTQAAGETFTPITLSSYASQVQTAMATSLRYKASHDEILKSLASYVDQKKITEAEANTIIYNLGL